MLSQPISHRPGLASSLIFLGFLLTGAAFAQTATVNGVVTDSTRAVITGASVTISNLETGLRRETRTNDTGNYNFTLLPVGRYRVEATMAGFGIQTHPELK